MARMPNEITMKVTLDGHDLVAVAQPGNVVFLQVDRRMTKQEFHELEDRLRACHEETGVHIVILDNGIHVAKIRSDGEGQS